MYLNYLKRFLFIITLINYRQNDKIWYYYLLRFILIYICSNDMHYADNCLFIIYKYRGGGAHLTANIGPPTEYSLTI